MKFVKKIRYYPFGYRISNGEIETIPEEARLVKQLFNDYLIGDSLQRLAMIGIYKAHPYKHWQIVQNRPESGFERMLSIGTKI